MKQLLNAVGATVGATALVMVAAMGAQAAGSRNSEAQQFVTKAAGGGLGEVKLGELAVQKASRPDVKQFGQRMIDDHSKANEQLATAAKAEGLTVPSQPDKESQQAYNKLSKLSGPAFDRAYADDMVRDHENDVKLFQHEAQAGSDPAIKSFASQTLPVLQDHLKMARDIDSRKVGAK